MPSVSYSQRRTTPARGPLAVSDVFFIVGCWRSGTTALAQILETAENARVLVEPAPKLAFESRELREGRLADPASAFEKARGNLISRIHAEGLKYGEKNATLLEFVPALAAGRDRQFVFVIRDGRDVVRSLMDWRRFRPVIYGQEEDGESPRLEVNPADPWAYYMPRPRPGDAWHSEWRRLSFFEKCAWYWDDFNRRLLDAADGVDPGRYRMVDMTRADAATMRGLFEFLGLTGFDESRAGTILEGRINSLYARTGEEDSFPPWRQWTAEQTSAFETMAGDTMRRLGYV